MGLRVAELETLFLADISDFTKKADQVDKIQKALAKSDPTVKVQADATGAIADMGRVEAGAKTIDGTTATAKLDADSSKALAGVGEAAAALARVDGDTATIRVDADTSRAKADIGALGGEGGKAGRDAGEGLSAGIIGALVALPVAGSVVGIGVAIGKALTDGIQVEVRSDRLMAQTGLDEKSIAPIARAAGEAYANNFGPSIAENMDTARIAIQGGLLDPKRAAEDSQKIIESLSGVADFIGNDIAAVSRSTAVLLRTGLAKDAAGAFDLIVKGSQKGLDVSEDMLDTINEYSTQFRELGLSGPESFGLLRQAIQGGARDTDVAADAIKEFVLRTKDGTAVAAVGFDELGVSGKKMLAAINEGGPAAHEMLGTLLTKLRDIKDPADRNAAALALFGTKAEDLGDAVYSMDLSNAVQQLGSVEGAAKSALDTLGDNTAGKLASAQRNIEVAADGIKGALATAFAPQIEGFATFVTTNREAVMQFLLDMANAALDAGRTLANAAASGTEGFGSMVATVTPMILDITESVLKVGQAIAFAMDPTGVLGLRSAADEAIDSFRVWKPTAEAGAAAIKTGSEAAAAAIRDKLIKEGIDPAQARLNAIAIPMVAQAKMHDMALKLAAEIDAIKQGKVPGIDANTKAGKAKIAALQAQLDALHDKSISVQIHENYTQTGAHNLGSRAAKANGGTVRAEADGAHVEAASNGLVAGKFSAYQLAAYQLAAGGHIPPPPGHRTHVLIGSLARLATW